MSERSDALAGLVDEDLKALYDHVRKNANTENEPESAYWWSCFFCEGVHYAIHWLHERVEKRVSVTTDASSLEGVVDSDTTKSDG